MSGIASAWRWGLAAAVLSAAAAHASPAATELRVAASIVAEANDITRGAHDAEFAADDGRTYPHAVWLRLEAAGREDAAALVVRRPRGVDVALYAAHPAAARALGRSVALPEYRGIVADVFVLPPGTGTVVYGRVDTHGGSLREFRVTESSLEAELGRGARHARMIALACGALLAMSLSALLIWFVLADRLFVLYAAFFTLQGLYVAYLSGQAYEWPWLAWAAPFGSHAWNVPVALSGAVACLFVREIADLRHFSPRVFAAFRWLAVAFVVLAASNVAKLFGFTALVSAFGNLLFIGTAIFTLAVSFLAWRRGIRAAGWFLLAWGLLEAFTIATAIQLLVVADAERLLYFGLPLSMVAAAVLIALGVADRLREQRAALTDAERRAQTDALTGVLNRRSLLERLDAACLRARARDLPIALLFIDLDHFKAINDSYGHAAGDACLRAIIGPIQAELRQSDVIGRYGGEEFVVILSSADSAAAQPIAERILERVGNIRVEGFGASIALTCSIGVAASDTLGVWGEELIARADAAVYAAKKAGRNRIQLAPSLAA